MMKMQPDLINRVDEEVLERLRLKAFDFVSFKPRSEREFRDRLKVYCQKEKLNTDEVNKILDSFISDFKEEGFLDDEKYALDYIDSVSNSPKTRSTSKVRTFLLKKGIPKEIIENAVKELDSDFELKNATRDAERKLKRISDLSVIKQKQKLIQFLKSRAYSYEIIFKVVDSLL